MGINVDELDRRWNDDFSEFVCGPKDISVSIWSFLHLQSTHILSTAISLRRWTFRKLWLSYVLRKLQFAIFTSIADVLVNDINDRKVVILQDIPNQSPSEKAWPSAIGQFYFNARGQSSVTWRTCGNLLLTWSRSLFSRFALPNCQPFGGVLSTWLVLLKV